MMNQLIADFSKHLEEALKVGKQTKFSNTDQSFLNVLICGLGGSGIGGTIISQLVADKCHVPIIVNKDYHIPAFVNEDTLVICCSYSGNTEETLSMYAAAVKKGATVSVITSGGKFAEIAEKEDLNIIQIRGGFPPRAAFGLSFPQLFFTLTAYGMIDQTFIPEVEKAIQTLNQNEGQIQKAAKTIAEQLHGKLPIIYSESSLEGVAVRFRQQINENSKMLCWHHAIPEMNHNELVGWRTENQNLAVVYLRSEHDYYRNAARIKQNKEVISKYTSTIIDMQAKGESAIERALFLIHLGDWVSEFIAQLKGIDSVEVDVITGLKNMLGKLD
jgi:glucose/mannose-6-phosphate isomerase